METTTLQFDIPAMAQLVEDGADPFEMARLVEDGADFDAIAAYHRMTSSLPENVNVLSEVICGRYESNEHFIREYTERFARDYVADMYDMSEPAISYFDYAKYWECELSHYYSFDRRTGYVLMTGK